MTFAARFAGLGSRFTGPHSVTLVGGTGVAQWRSTSHPSGALGSIDRTVSSGNGYVGVGCGTGVVDFMNNDTDSSLFFVEMPDAAFAASPNAVTPFTELITPSGAVFSASAASKSNSGGRTRFTWTSTNPPTQNGNYRFQ